MAIESLLALGLATSFLVGLAVFVPRQRVEIQRKDVAEDQIAVQTALRNIFIRDLRLALPMTDEDRARDRVECEEWRAMLETRLQYCPEVRTFLPALSEAAWEQAKRAMKICYAKDIEGEKETHQ